ncbi:hypothetical protein AWENTII_012481 [Aspergillus wentii]|nr:hypothetical protein MW887_002716 [Aspergillus wentii]
MEGGPCDTPPATEKRASVSDDPPIAIDNGVFYTSSPEKTLRKRQSDLLEAIVSAKGLAKILKKKGNTKQARIFQHMKQFLEDDQSDPNFLENGWSPLSASALSPSTFLMLDLLLKDDRTSVDMCNEKGRTALSYAAEAGNVDAVRALLEKADPNIKDQEGYTPLSWAVNTFSSTSHSKVISLLVDKGADINTEDNKKLTPLARAADEGISDAVMHLLSFNQIDKNHKDIDQRTPLSLAAKSEHIQIMELLLESGAEDNCYDNKGHTCWWWLLQARIKSRSSSIYGEIPINHSAESTDSLAAYLNPNLVDSSGRNLLSLAAEYGDSEFVEVLLRKKEVNPDHRDPDRTPLIWALEKERWQVVNMLIPRDANSLHILITDYHWIGRERALELVKALVREGYDVNKKDVKGTTPLHLASNQLDFARKLVSTGVNLDVQDNIRKTALQYALGYRNTKVALLLLNHGADIQASDLSELLAIAYRNGLYVHITQESGTERPKFDLVSNCNDKHEVACTPGYTLK